ncbi:MAG TPA: glycerol-3-phosphate cytidylyltransferase [Bacteroidia bacterium]|jgi:glycerol-3-phosphate cytidylyltransferase|nr:glycerol-3-phosphate cytidylyltransferase [Bacteroidota bacterium]MCC7513544.1 glycerol-3-phosphate cytidylyltransferase [Bacteroidia bacterium]HCI58936.1 glycerol-3-phosphate cytidylyltransferase [Bacteroidota bacterium]HPA31038.1 glycerol-3-phosphate cytidylyltransferase [Bacteroidia bacterium]HQP00888.1 glycerol-3-phosphate cytidylyltransferase [Bacteroidia bacterium]
MTTVITYGTFDLFHFGHLELLKRAAAYGDRLIVVLSTDEFNLQKNKISRQPYDLRKQNLECIKFVSLVIPENNWEQKENDIKTHHVNTLVMGDDWNGKFDYLMPLCKVIYLPRTPGISSSILKEIENNKS